MSKLYKGNVGIKTSKSNDGNKTLRLQSNVEGVFNSENAGDLFAKALEVSKTHKLDLNSWSFWNPVAGRAIKATDAKVVKDGTLVPVLQADRFGKPRLTLLPPMAKKSGASFSSEWLA